MTIRKKQLKVFEQLTMFEQHILCHKIPNSLNSMEIDIDEELSTNKRHKIIQDIKRRQLHNDLERYETTIQHYEHLYEEEFNMFKSDVYKSKSSYQMFRIDTLIHTVTSYIYQHTKQIIRHIRYKESCRHVTLTRQHQHRRHHYSRSQSSATNNTLNVYPQVILDVSKVPLNRLQLDYLSHTGNLLLFV